MKRPAEPATTCIEVDDAYVAFGAKEVLRGITLHIPRGQAIAILGESGGGKTVLLKVMLGLIPPDAGRVRLLGVEIGDLSEEELSPIRARCSVVYQGGALFSGMNVGENIALELKEVLGLPEAEITKRVREALDAVGLGDVNVSLAPHELSGGMKKRLAVARAIAPQARGDLLRRADERPRPAQLRAHPRADRRPPPAAERDQRRGHARPARRVQISDRIVLLAGGRIAFDGPPAGFVASPDPTVVAFRSSAPGFEEPATVIR